MAKSIRSVLIIAFFSIFIFAGIISAEEANTNSQDNQTTTQQEEIITPEDLGVKEPTILSDNNFYFLKNWVRNIQLALTFSPIKKAELQLKFANEKIIETEKMVKLNKALGKIDNAFKNYQETMVEMTTATEKIKEKVEESPEVGKFLEKFTNQSALQQRILAKLESKVSTTTAQKIIEVREAHLEKFGEVMQKLENRAEKQVEILNSLKDKILNKRMISTNATSQASGCNNLWWFDNTSEICQQKQFCGMYMYFGLHTFDSKEECEKELLEAD